MLGLEISCRGPGGDHAVVGGCGWSAMSGDWRGWAAPSSSGGQNARPAPAQRRAAAPPLWPHHSGSDISVPSACLPLKAHPPPLFLALGPLRDTPGIAGRSPGWSCVCFNVPKAQAAAEGSGARPLPRSTKLVVVFPR